MKTNGKVITLVGVCGTVASLSAVWGGAPAIPPDRTDAVAMRRLVEVIPIPEAQAATTCQSVRMVQVVDQASGVAVNMDVYEASRPDATATSAGTFNGPACSRAGVLPWTNVSWAEAAQACKKSSKRLCTPKEWKAACQSAPQSNAFPYGGFNISDYKQGVCNDSKTGLTPTGSRSGCVTKTRGFFDMSGNAGEWLYRVAGSTSDEFAGGTFALGSLNLMCEDTISPPTANFKGIGVGFRCCSGV